MNMIQTFGLVVKPIITEGKGMWNPLPAKQLFGDVFCLRDKDSRFRLSVKQTASKGGKNVNSSI